ncbi:MAG: class I SAM-dependent methyltransferase, partial [Actinomycetota bacterium]
HPHLGPRVLEIGSGRGDLTAGFADGRSLLATDCSETNLTHLRERFAAERNISVEALDAAQYQPRERFDSIVMINVLEHIEDDVTALRRLASGVAPGGKIVIYVPAYAALYSPWDAKIGHFRRYTMPSLAATVRAAGLRTSEMRYVNAFGALMWFAFCRVLRQEPAQTWVVRSWDALALPVLHAVEKRVSPPFGISVFCVAKRA